MPFETTSGRGDLRTFDAEQAAAFVTESLRPGIITKVSADTEINFSSHYFARTDFLVSEIRTGPGWSFQPRTEVDTMTAWLTLDGQCSVQHRGVSGLASADGLLVTSGPSSKRIDFDRPYHGLVVVACSEFVRQETEAFLGRSIETNPDFLTTIDARSRLGQTLVAFASTMHAALAGNSSLADSPLALRRFRDGFISLVLMSMDAEEVQRLAGPPRSASSANLRAAEAFMRDNADQPIGMSDVAAHVGVSVRALQYTFRRLRGTTPLAVLLQYRLEGARNDLMLGGKQKIAAVAAKWGFSHLGRFSRQYRAAFGEKASWTLANSQLRRH